MTKARKYWRMFCSSLNLNRNTADNLFEKLSSRYANPIRHHHTLEGHITECIYELNMARYLLINPIETEAGLWMHDACYDTHSYTNEEESADWAVEFYQAAGAILDFDKLRDLILMTKHHKPINDCDAFVFSDCDLSVLGKPKKIFDEYERNIRREYEWVPEAVFREHRANLFEDFLKRPRIYYTDPFKEKYEERARLNIARSIELLKSEKPLL